MTHATLASLFATMLSRWFDVLLSNRIVQACCGLLGCVVIVAGAVLMLRQNQLPEREQNSTLQLPLCAPSQAAWKSENAFPKLRFFEPTCVAAARDGSGRVLILERRGTVQLIQDDPATSVKTQVLDISAQVTCTRYEDDGAYGLVLHPEFGKESSANAGSFFVMYTAGIDNENYVRLSKFTLKGNVATDETVLIEQLNEHIYHNGGGLAFGTDGFLYVGVGDEGTNGDALSNGQRINRDLYCGVLRIDVDCLGGDISHPPRRQPDTGRTSNYFIPNDNPFIDVPDALEEFWCHGLRNPFRLSFDPSTGNLWSGDVGHLSREEINLIRRGGNYGWSYAEGSLSFGESYLAGKKPVPYYGTEYRPIFEYPHVNGNTCVIGGYVYRGSQFPELEGKFLFADNGSGRVWALQADGDQVISNTELFTIPESNKTGIASIEPNADGEPWIVILGAAGEEAGAIHRLLPAESDGESNLPLRLSETGLFSFIDATTLTPSEGMIEYSVNASQSTQGAEVQRWILLPGNGKDQDVTVDRIEFSLDDPWRFPVGTVFVQHFEMPMDTARPQVKRRLETRVLRIHDGGGSYGMNYRWNDAGTDADLVQSPAVAELECVAKGVPRTIEWQFSSSDTCTACHNANAGHVLGVNTRQINRTHEYGFLSRTLGQLEEWNRVGMFQNPLGDEAIIRAPRLADPFDPHADLDSRARSFLDVNCSACHRPSGARSHFDARFVETATGLPIGVKPHQADFGILDGSIVTPGDPFRSVLYYRLAKLGQGRMPFVATQPLEKRELDLVRHWIAGLPSEHDSHRRDRQPTTDAELIDQLASGAIRMDEHPQLLDHLLADTTTAFQLWQKIYDGTISGQHRDEIVSLAISSSQQNVRDLFERFVPVEQRTQRLGTQFDPLDVLRLSGDAERGRELYTSMDGLNCRGCHSLQEGGPMVGPNLRNIGEKYDAAKLLRQITHPDEKIADEFRAVRLLTLDGVVISGIRVAESPTEIQLSDAAGKLHRIAVDDIDAISQQSKSLMPEHLLQSLTAQQAADLLAFLRSLQ